jgi:hypothetical protein
VARDGRGPAARGPPPPPRPPPPPPAEAMQLDINPYWMSFMYYNPARNPADPAPASLLPDQQQPASRYYSVNSRDFTAVYTR